MITPEYFYHLFGQRLGYVYQYTGSASDQESITAEFVTALENHTVSTMVTQVEDITVVYSPEPVTSEQFVLMAEIVAPEPLPPPPDPIPIFTPNLEVINNNV